MIIGYCNRIMKITVDKCIYMVLESVFDSITCTVMYKYLYITGTCTSTRLCSRCPCIWCIDHQYARTLNGLFSDLLLWSYSSLREGKRQTVLVSLLCGVWRDFIIKFKKCIYFTSSARARMWKLMCIFKSIKNLQILVTGLVIPLN